MSQKVIPFNRKDLYRYGNLAHRLIVNLACELSAHDLYNILLNMIIVYYSGPSDAEIRTLCKLTKEERLKMFDEDMATLREHIIGSIDDIEENIANGNPNTDPGNDPRGTGPELKPAN